MIALKLVSKSETTSVYEAEKDITETHTYVCDGNSYTANTWPAHWEKARKVVGYTPGYAKKVSEGLTIPHTPFLYDSGKVSIEESTRHASWGTSTCAHVWNDIFKGPPYYSRPPLPGGRPIGKSLIEMPEYESRLKRVSQRAVADAWLNGMQILVSWAERHKTIALFKKAGSRILKLIRKLRFDQLWLEYRYGWRLLYYDILAINDAIEKEIAAKGYTRVNGTAKEKPVDIDEIDLYHFGDGQGYLYDLVYRSKITGTIKGSAQIDLFLPTTGSFFTSIPSTVLELIPFSFVVNWFITTGEALAAMEASVLAKSVVTSASAGLLWDTTIYSALVANPPPPQTTVHTVFGTAQRQTTERVPLPVTSKVFLQNRLDLFKVADLVALVTSAWKTRLKSRK